MKKLILILTCLFPLMAFAQRTPINKGFLQSNFDGNLKSITNVAGMTIYGDVNKTNAVAIGTFGMVVSNAVGSVTLQSGNGVFGTTTNGTISASNLVVVGNNGSGVATGISIKYDHGTTANYDIGRNGASGYLRFTGSQAGNTGYEFNGPLVVGLTTNGTLSASNGVFTGTINQSGTTANGGTNYFAANTNTFLGTIFVPSGSVTAPGLAFSAAPNSGFYYANGVPKATSSGGFAFQWQSGYLQMGSSGIFTWSSNADGTGASDATLSRQVAGTVLINTNLVIGPTTNGTISAGGYVSRASNLAAPVSFTFPATTVNFTNPATLNIQIYIDNFGVTGSSLKKNGTQIFSGITQAMTLNLQPGEYFSETYTVGTPVGTYSPF